MVADLSLWLGAIDDPCFVPQHGSPDTRGWRARAGAVVLVAVLVAIQRPPMPFKADRPRPLVQVEPIGTGKIRAANAVWVDELGVCHPRASKTGE